MPSITSSISSLISSIVHTITSTISTILALFQSLFSTIFDLFATVINTILTAFGTLISGVAQTFEGVGRFLLSNVLVIATIGLAIGGYVMYQNKRGGAATVPGTSKKIN